MRIPVLLLLFAAVYCGFINKNGAGVAMSAEPRGVDVYGKITDEDLREWYMKKWNEEVATGKTLITKLEKAQRRFRSAKTDAKLEDKIEKIEAYQEKLEKNNPVFIPILKIRELEAGRIGRVVEDMEIFQIVSGGKFLAKFGASNIVYITGMDVSDQVDGDQVHIDAVMRVTKTTYETAIGGTNTVYVLSPIPDHAANDPLKIGSSGVLRFEW